MTDADRRLTVDEIDTEISTFLEAHATRRAGGEATGELSDGPDRVALPVVSALSEAEERASLEAARRFQAALFDAGLAWISGPPELGGRGLTSAHERRFTELAAAYELPDRSQLRTGTRIIAPSIVHFATADVSRAVVPSILRGDVVVCQLFSEPAAGSDLANVQTRAELQGEAWRVSGQKVWSSGAHVSDLGACLVRTSRPEAKHRGLTMLLVDMAARGVEVRPIKQMTGGSEFDEVFLDDVEVHDAKGRVGDVDGGWAVALAMLMNERSAIGDELLPGREVSDRLVELCRRLEAPEDVRLQAADVLARMMATRWMVDGVLAAQEAGAAPGPELAAAKLAITDDVQRVSDVVTELLGTSLVADTGLDGAYAWTEFLLGVHGLRVGGGTDEVLLNTIGERVLGLPREPRPTA